MRTIPTTLQLDSEHFDEAMGELLLKDKATGYPLLVKNMKEDGNVPGDLFYTADEAAIAFVLNYKIPEIEQECIGSIHYRSDKNKWYFTQGITLPQVDEERSVEDVNLNNKVAEFALQRDFHSIVCTASLDNCSTYAKYFVSEDGILKFRSN